MKTKKEELEAELTRLNDLRKQVKEKLKALPVYELNRWYKHPNGSLYFINNECEDGHLYGYGFDNDGDWSVRNNDNYRFCAFNSVAKKEITEATPQEVEQALIEEAKRRGLVNGVKINSLIDGDSAELNGDRYFFHLYPLYFNLGSRHIFANGQWATITEQDKFAELKEAHENGVVIQYERLACEWVDIDGEPAWYDDYNYRIKPEEKPTLKDNDIAIIERLHDALLDNHGYDLNSKLLSDSRELCKRIQCIIEKGAN